MQAGSLRFQRFAFAIWTRGLKPERCAIVPILSACVPSVHGVRAQRSWSGERVWAAPAAQNQQPKRSG
jgi:hypothetical protein